MCSLRQAGKQNTYEVPLQQSTAVIRDSRDLSTSQIVVKRKGNRCRKEERIEGRGEAIGASARVVITNKRVTNQRRPSQYEFVRTPCTHRCSFKEGSSMTAYTYVADRLEVQAMFCEVCSCDQRHGSRGHHWSSFLFRMEKFDACSLWPGSEGGFRAIRDHATLT